ncbi:PREDICTED: uncharacterized protein LOC105453329 [Wasmannia auropunctata]|uniref:uncharacterized protein LOC105453329 n=1 Tax=Wasmannia auropunctata TaxID=64793 RepID=UPI0005F067BC|nr:PREDICTED: uncharacterized protein LOC105453329 [Wasmannia auropunctata]XP_011693474.1 PREDICTED: uncharacterized protein LOC105453329 [Wasmannia auropunctata]
MKKVPTPTRSQDKLESTGSTVSAGSFAISSNGNETLAMSGSSSIIDTTIDCFLKYMKEIIKDETASKKEIKNMIMEVIREIKMIIREGIGSNKHELGKDETECKKDIEIIKEIIRREIKPFIKQELEDLRKMQGGTDGLIGEDQRSYSEAAKEKKKENVIIKLEIQQEELIGEDQRSYSEAAEKKNKENVIIKTEIQQEENLILYTNVQSLTTHKDEVQDKVNKKNPVLIALSETRLTKKIKDSKVNIPGYTIATRQDFETGNSGGVIIYVRDDIIHTEEFSDLKSKCWCVAAIHVKNKVYKGFVVVLYRSPTKFKLSNQSNTDPTFIKFLEEMLEKKLIIKGECIMIIGDFNINFMDSKNFYTNSLKTTMLSLGMKQYVNRPTRIINGRQTIIDLVFANKEVELQVDYESQIADHAWLKVKLNASRSENKYREYSVRDSQFEVDVFHGLVVNKLEEIRRLNISDRAEQFVYYIIDALNIIAPIKQIRVPIWNEEKWSLQSDEMREADLRDEAYGKARCNDMEQNYLQFTIEENSVDELNKKNKYYENMIDRNKDNPTNMWKILKEMVRDEPTDNEKYYECNIADKFNLYYTQSINTIVESINSNKITDDIIETIDECVRTVVIKNKGMDKFEIINVENLNKIVMRLLNKKGTVEVIKQEKITSDVLQKVWYKINEEFVDIINTSLREGCCPEVWKTSTIIPIPKIENAKKTSEYRPINTLSIFEEVLELVVKRQIEGYLGENNIITEHQSSFRKQYLYDSYETTIQIIIDEWRLIVKREKVGVIFIDLKRAFETIDRERLFKKLCQYAIGGKVLEWLKSYFEKRTQQVRFNNEWSNLLTTEYGVPRGSVLGPLLFIIYINDIIKVCPEGCNIKMFADDMLIYVTDENGKELENKMNTAFNKVETWMNVNKLKINTEKTKFMIVKDRYQTRIKDVIVLKCLDGTEIERVEEIKFLDIIIDDNLQFENHCNHIISNKIGEKMSILNRINSYVSPNTMCIIYESSIAPYFEHFATLLFNMQKLQKNKKYKNKNLSKMERLQEGQNRVMRAILQCDINTEAKNMLQKLQFMSVKQSLYYNVCIFISQTKNAQESTFYEVYNTLPPKIKQCKGDKFKRKLKKYVLDNIL